MNERLANYCNDHPWLPFLGIICVGWMSGALTYRVISCNKPMRPAKSLVAAGVGAVAGAVLGGVPGAVGGGGFALIAHDRIHDAVRERRKGA